MKVFDKIAQTLLEMIGTGLWGFKPNLMQHIVEQHGAISSLLWFVQNMPTYERTLREWGAIRTHLLVAEISVLNGCPYCTYGHAYALQLHYFKNTGRLMPVDENEIVAWHTFSESDAIVKFRQLIDASGISSEMPILERMLFLRQGGKQSQSVDDSRILHLMKMFSFLNQCGIKGKTNRDQAHDPINKETFLLGEYNQLRKGGIEIQIG